jgi:hypothetical protein
MEGIPGNVQASHSFMRDFNPKGYWLVSRSQYSLSPFVGFVEPINSIHDFVGFDEGLARKNLRNHQAMPKESSSWLV